MTAGARSADTARPAEGLPYHRIQEAGLPGLWRPIAGVLLMAVGRRTAR